MTPPTAPSGLYRALVLAALPALVLLPACSEANGSNGSEGAEAVAARSTPGGRETSRTTLVVVETLHVGPVRDEVVVSAKVAARTSVAIYPKLSGLPVTKLFKEEGDAVADDELLLTLFDTDLQLAAQTADAALQEAAIEVQRCELAIEEQKHRVKSAERAAQKAAADLQRLTDLGDLVNRKEVDDARLAADNASDELELRAFAERTSGVALDVARSAVRRAEIEAERARTNLEYSRVKSPTAGIIAERYISEGELVNAGNPVFTVVDTSDLVLNLRVPQDSLARLAKGQPVDVRPVTGDAGAAGALFHGVVRTVNQVLDEGTGTVRVTVDMEPAAGLVPGLFCEAHIVTAARGNALLVSKRAVLYEDDQPVLFAVDAGADGAASARKIPFVAGASTSGDVEIVSDLSGAPLAHDLRVIVVGQENLKDGAAVKVVEEAF